MLLVVRKVLTDHVLPSPFKRIRGGNPLLIRVQEQKAAKVQQEQLEVGGCKQQVELQATCAFSRES